MSWSVRAVGKPAAAAAKLAAQFAAITCAEPEQSIKNSVADVVKNALVAFPDDCPVNVEASGSQSAVGDKAANQLSVKIEPIWGFVE